MEEEEKKRSIKILKSLIALIERDKAENCVFSAEHFNDIIYATNYYDKNTPCFKAHRVFSVTLKTKQYQGGFNHE